MCCHPLHGVGDLAGRAAQARTFKENYLASQTERIDYGRVPIVQGPGEVLKTQERQTISFPKASIGVLFEVGLDELRGCGSVACICHDHISFCCGDCCGLGRPLQRRTLSRAHPSTELGQTFGVPIMTPWDRANDTVEKNAGDLRCGIDMELF